MNPGPYDYGKMGITKKSRNTLVELGYCGFKKPLKDKDLEDILRGYYATTSFIDFEIGRLIQALESQKIRENTIVVIFGDNGFHLGENGVWAKKTNFEAGARVPLMICGAGVKAKGRSTKALVELVDLYPTLIEMAGIPNPDTSQLEGTSLVPLLSNPDRSWKRAAFTQIENKEYSIRTKEYRLIASREPNGELKPSALYQENLDPLELKNLVNDPEKAEIVKSLLQELKQGWKAASQRNSGLWKPPALSTAITSKSNFQQ
jgi:arylsulfatase A-like enzyme